VPVNAFGKAAAFPEFQQRGSGMSARAHPALYRVVMQPGHGARSGTWTAWPWPYGTGDSAA
jgi:hypothetical protein